jgi:hypothetical protein
MGIEFPHGTHSVFIINLEQVLTISPDEKDKTRTIFHLAPTPTHANIITMPYAEVVAKLKASGWVK